MNWFEVYEARRRAQLACGWGLVALVSGLLPSAGPRPFPQTIRPTIGARVEMLSLLESAGPKMAPSLGALTQHLLRLIINK